MDFPTAPRPIKARQQRSVDLLEAAWTYASEILRTLEPWRQSTGTGPLDTYHGRGSSLVYHSVIDDSQLPRDFWKANESQITLFDGTVMERDDTNDTWRFRAPLMQTIGAMSTSLLPRMDEKYSRRPVVIDDSATDNASSSNEALPALPPASFSKPHEIAFIINVCLAQFLALAALAQTIAPLLIIGDAFGVSNPGQLSWFTAAYGLTLGTFILPAGRMGDAFGHKKIFTIGWAWFAAWSFVAGFSYTSSSMMLTICRAFQGIGPALLVPNAMALIGRTFPIGMKRNIIVSLFGASGPTGFVIGAVFSSIFAQLAWWPWAFWTLSIVCCFAFALTLFAIPKDNIAAHADPSMTAWQRFDVPGALTGVSGLVLINFAWNQAPIVGWSTPYIPFLLAMGILLICGFVYIELKDSTMPLIPIRGLHKEAGFALACIAAGWASHGIWLYYFYLFAERVRGHSALSACAQIAPVALIGPLAALSVGFMLKKIKVAYVMLMAMLAFLIGTVFLATAPAIQIYWGNTFLSVVIMPFGMNLSFPAATILMANALPRESQGIAASLVSTMVNYSISTGLGMAGTIDRYVGEKDVLAGYRGAWYFSIGLTVAGVAISGYFVRQSRAEEI